MACCVSMTCSTMVRLMESDLFQRAKACLDCDDSDDTVCPDCLEWCGTEQDEDCDGETDEENASDCENYYVDADGDGRCGEDPPGGWDLNRDFPDGPQPRGRMSEDMPERMSERMSEDFLQSVCEGESNRTLFRR